MSTSGGPTTVSMTNATYARSVSGKESLINDFYGDIENLIKVLNGDKYAAFKKTIQENWTGVDADDFLADVEKTRKELQSKLTALKAKFNGAITSDAKQFLAFQDKNVK